MQVLVVDDSPVARRAVSELVRSLGAHSVEAVSVEAAEAIAAREPPDATITDFDLPDGTGLDVARAARASHPTMPLAFLTSDRARAAAAGASALGPVFSKLEPLEPLSLWLATVLAERRPEDAT